MMAAKSIIDSRPHIALAKLLVMKIKSFKIIIIIVKIIVMKLKDRV